MNSVFQNSTSGCIASLSRSMVHSQYCSASITSRFVLNTSSTRLASLMKCGWFGASLAAQLACSRK